MGTLEKGELRGQTKSRLVQFLVEVDVTDRLFRSGDRASPATNRAIKNAAVAPNVAPITVHSVPKTIPNKAPTDKVKIVPGTAIIVAIA